jgi:hypothetical protein
MLRYLLSLAASFCLLAAAASGAENLFKEQNHDFGSVPRGPTLSYSFRLTNTTGAELHISGVRVSCGCVTAWAPKTELKPGQEGTIEARMDTSRFTNVRRVTIFVQLDQPRWEEVQLSVQANSRDDVALAPESLAFGHVRQGSPAETRLKIAFGGGGQWKVLDARSDSGYVVPKVEKPSGSGDDWPYHLTARLQPGLTAGTWQTGVWLTTDNPAVPKLRVSATVTIDPAVSVSPAVANLGELKTGAEAERRVLVRAPQPFRITRIQGTDAQLSVTDSVTESKAIHTLVVKFKAGSPGDLKRTIKVLTDMKDSPEVSFEATAQTIP